MALSHLSNYAMFKLEALGTRDDDMMMMMVDDDDNNDGDDDGNDDDDNEYDDDYVPCSPLQKRGRTFSTMKSVILRSDHLVLAGK